MVSTGKKVLVVDDDQDVIALTETILKAEGYEVITACDGKSGIEKAEAEKPDLILLDIVMEDVDAGLSAAEKLGNHFPVILISSIADSASKVFDIHELPIKGVLQKPVKRDVLLQKAAQALAE